MSVVKNLYWKERLPFIKNITGIREDWDPCRQTLEGHSDWVYAVAFSPDGTALASASGDRDVATGAARQTLEGHSEWVNAAAFSPDGTALASASYDDTVRLWDVATGVGTQTFDIKIAVTKLSFSEDGGYLKTDRGILNLNPDSPAICLQKVLTSAILVETEWVTRDGQNLLWLPPDYRATCCAVYNNKLVLGHASGMVTHLEFVSS
jgi:WD40 repeat protein